MKVKRKMNSTTQLVLDVCWLQYDWLYLICLALFHLQSFQILLRIITACPTCSLFLVARLPVADRWEIVGNRAGERPKHPVCLCYCRTEERGNTHSREHPSSDYYLHERKRELTPEWRRRILSWTRQEPEKKQTQHEWKGHKNKNLVILCDVIHSYQPHSAQTWEGCKIYETAQSPGDPSSSPLPVKAEHESCDQADGSSCRRLLCVLRGFNYVFKKKEIPGTFLSKCESSAPCSSSKEAALSVPSRRCWIWDKKPSVIRLETIYYYWL